MGVDRQGEASRREADPKETSKSLEVSRDPESADPCSAAGESGDHPHDSATGSNGLNLSKHHQGSPLSRTSGSSSDPSLVEHTSKALPSPSSAEHPGPGGGVGTADGEEVRAESEGNYSTSQDSLPLSAVHRARKTMPRSTSIQTVLQVTSNNVVIYFYVTVL